MATAAATDGDGYDAFLSHGTPDKPWVEAPRAELGRRGLRCFLDHRELVLGENGPSRLGRELLHSRSLPQVENARIEPGPRPAREPRRSRS